VRVVHNAHFSQEGLAHRRKLLVRDFGHGNADTRLHFPGSYCPFDGFVAFRNGEKQLDDSFHNIHIGFLECSGVLSDNDK